jgi:hypothetical protein
LVLALSSFLVVARGCGARSLGLFLQRGGLLGVLVCLLGVVLGDGGVALGLLAVSLGGLAGLLRPGGDAPVRPIRQASRA